MPEPRSLRYLHLLSQEEIVQLKPVLEILKGCRGEVLERWYRKYVEHFTGAFTLGKAEFLRIYGRDLDAVIDNLMEQDMDGFETDARSVGRELVAAGVPFVEVVASLHLFEESASESFRSHLRVMVHEPGIFLTFDKLSHCRMILLAGTYFEGQNAETTSRILALEDEAGRLAGKPKARGVFHGLHGRSLPMRRVYEQIAAAAGAIGAVLVAGESGTGKELVARALHECAGPAGRPFIVVNCAALPRELIESELFGHGRGAYTGAATESRGLVRAASGGTLFLDEVTEMAAKTQAKLLRLIEEQKVRPVGSEHELPVKVRFIASTNRDPEGAVASGILRKDLYYRLSVHRIEVPPLRDRLSDIPYLVAHFAELLAAIGMRRIDGCADDTLESLAGYHWPGNVRELRNAVEHALTVCNGKRIRRKDIPKHIAQAAAPGHAAGTPTEIPSFDEAEKQLVKRALAACNGNKVHAAKMLRISRHRLYDKIKKYSLQD